MSFDIPTMPMSGTLGPVVTLWIPGKPSSWSRGVPVKGGGNYSFIVKTRKDRTAQEIIRETFSDYLQLHPELRDMFPWSGAIRLHYHAFYSLPKKYKRKKSITYPAKTSAPDTSNLIKQVEDSFNRLRDSDLPTPYFDDACITQVYGTKQYHPHREGVLVVLEMWDTSEPNVIPTEDIPTIPLPGDTPDGWSWDDLIIAKERDNE